ncbi:hypothetical protein SEUCBS139899_003489 [Sporothrix eucalyptigena]
MAKPQTFSQWDLQEAITENRTASRTTYTSLNLRLELISGGNTVPPSSSSPYASLGPSLTTRAANRQRAKAADNAKPSYRIQVVEGSTVVKEISTNILHPSNSEVRIVPPTRATILYPDPDEPPANRTAREKSSGLSRSKTEIQPQSSQINSQNGSEKKKRCFLKLCFLSVSDLKTASHEFMRIGLRCTSLQTPDNRATLQRTSSVVSVRSSQGSQNRDCAGSAAPGSRASLSQSTYTTTSTVPTALPAAHWSQSTSKSSLKRTYSEVPPDIEHADRHKRRQTSMAHDVHSPSLLRRDSSSADMLASPWTPSVNRAVNRSQSWSSNMTRLESRSPYEHRPASPIQTTLPVNDVEEPPPRRELPQSVTRHISQPSSQTEGSNNRSANSLIRKAAVAEIEVQTEAAFVEPETALFAGMSLFQELLGLKDRLIKECMTMITMLGGGNGDTDKAEARLAARYAIEFQTQFVSICSHHAYSYLS